LSRYLVFITATNVRNGRRPCLRNRGHHGRRPCSNTACLLTMFRDRDRRRGVLVDGGLCRQSDPNTAGAGDATRTTHPVQINPRERRSPVTANEILNGSTEIPQIPLMKGIAMIARCTGGGSRTHPGGRAAGRHEQKTAYGLTQSSPTSAPLETSMPSGVRGHVEEEGASARRVLAAHGEDLGQALNRDART